MAISSEQIQNITRRYFIQDFLGGKFPRQSNLIRSPFHDNMIDMCEVFIGGEQINAQVSINVTDDSDVIGYDGTQDIVYQSYEPIKVISYDWYAHVIGYQVDALDRVKAVSISKPSELLKDMFPVLAPAIDFVSKKGGELNINDVILETHQFIFLYTTFRNAFARLLMGDGTGSALKLQGIRSILTDVNDTGTIGGISRATNVLWRHNLGSVTIDTTSYKPEDCQIYNGLAALLKDCMEAVGSRNEQNYTRWVIYCSKEIYDYLEAEVRKNTTFNHALQHNMQGKDFGPFEYILMSGVPVVYDKLLDDQGDTDKALIIDHGSIRLDVFADAKGVVSTEGTKTIPVQLDQNLVSAYSPMMLMEGNIANEGTRLIGRKPFLNISGLVASQLNTSGLFTLIKTP